MSASIIAGSWRGSKAAGSSHTSRRAASGTASTKSGHDGHGNRQHHSRETGGAARRARRRIRGLPQRAICGRGRKGGALRTASARAVVERRSRRHLRRTDRPAEPFAPRAHHGRLRAGADGGLPPADDLVPGPSAGALSGPGVAPRWRVYDGAGSLPWYSGESFARSGLIMVSVNYRLGALGFLAVPGICPGNLGLLDQLAALRWVRENIAAFGGDSATVTVMGQSAGGGSIGALLAMPAARGLFRRAIMQSAALQRVNPSPDDAARTGRRFLEILGLSSDRPELLRDVPVDDLLAAQGELARVERRFADPVTPFRPLLDGRVVSTSPVAAVRAGAAASIDVLIGTTREEMAAFYSVDDRIKQADELALRGEFERLFGARGADYCSEYRRTRLDRRPAAVLADLYSDRLFRMPSLELAEAQAAHGRPAYVFQFDWQSPAGFEACHCLELPFVFDNLAHWSDAPMLAGADHCCKRAAGAGHAARMGRIRTPRQSRARRVAGLAALRRGAPDNDALHSVVEPVGDLAGRSWRTPWPTDLNHADRPTPRSELATGT